MFVAFVKVAPQYACFHTIAVVVSMIYSLVVRSVGSFNDDWLRNLVYWLFNVCMNGFLIDKNNTHCHTKSTIPRIIDTSTYSRCKIVNMLLLNYPLIKYNLR